MSVNVRNIAIIAHVDHGKTTLVDQLLAQSGTFRKNERVSERALDSNEIERERGITIFAKCTSVLWRKVKINIVDTPGHADFGGEVERILSMVDGVLILVDSVEGPMPQTKFVTDKALALGLRPIIVINKIDKLDARPFEVQDEVFELLLSLEASDEQLDFLTIFSSAKEGWASTTPEDNKSGMKMLFEKIVEYVPEPVSLKHLPFSMLITTIESDPFLGRLLIGKIHSGNICPNMSLKALSRSGNVIDQGRVLKLLSFNGLKRVPIGSASSGDIVAIAGLNIATVADTLCDLGVEKPLLAQPIDPPVFAVTVSINDSPLSGRDGKNITSTKIRDRLILEAQGNVAIKIRNLESKDSFEVAGRGELQIGVLIEQMRREGFELSISRPRILFRRDKTTNAMEEPMEEIQIDLDEEFVGSVVNSLALRKGKLVNYLSSVRSKSRLVFHVPSRGLIGYNGAFLTETRGTGVFSRRIISYVSYMGPIISRRAGVLVSIASGTSIAYGLSSIEDRGVLFVGPGTQIYEGMIIGEHNRESDLVVNPLKSKQLTNFRASGTDEAIRLIPPQKMSLETAMTYIADDELVEVTPNNIRLRKRFLKPNDRKRFSKTATKFYK